MDLLDVPLGTDWGAALKDMWTRGMSRADLSCLKPTGQLCQQEATVHSSEISAPSISFNLWVGVALSMFL